MQKVKVTNTGQRDRARMGHVFKAGKTAIVTPKDNRDLLSLKSCKDLKFEAAGKGDVEPPSAEEVQEHQFAADEYYDTVADAKKAVGKISDVAELAARYAHEQTHPKHEGGRTGVLAAIEDRVKALGGDPNEVLG